MDDLPQPPSPQMVMLMGTGGALGLEVVEAPRGRWACDAAAALEVPAEEGILMRGLLRSGAAVLWFWARGLVDRVERWEYWKGWFWVAEVGVLGTRMECLRVTENSSVGVVAARLSSVVGDVAMVVLGKGGAGRGVGAREAASDGEERRNE